MTGLENILAELSAQAEAAAAENRRKAEQEAEQILSGARVQAREAARRMDEESKAMVEKIAERAESAAALEKRRARLAAKQQIIRETIDEARESLYLLKDEDYFTLLQAMIEKYALPQEGELVLSQKDRERMPRGFLKQVNAALSGGSLILAEDSPYLAGGFLLRYGGIEENCTFDALFDAAREQLQDEVHQMLFEA